jgi:hypothetical protein
MEQKMPTLHFTDLAVSRLNSAGTYYDVSTPAFGIRVGKNRKTWFVIRGKERLNGDANAIRLRSLTQRGRGKPRPCSVSIMSAIHPIATQRRTSLNVG